MRRFLGIALIAGVVGLGLLLVNSIVLGEATRPAGQTTAGGRLIELSNVELQYIDQQATEPGPQGEPIVLLHCYTCSQRWWDPLAELLIPHHRVISFDLIGHGGSEKPSSGYEIESQSAAIAEALNELGVGQATVVGHSMGGVVATSLAEQSSDLVDRVVLIGTASEPGEAELPFAARAATAPLIGPAIWRLKLDSMVESASEESFAPGADPEALFADPDRVVTDIDDMTYGSFEASHEEIDVFLEQGSVVSRLTSIGVPVLAMDGTEDQILDAEQVLGDYEAIPGARIVAIEEAGHSPNVEQPQEVADQILGFTDAGGLGTDREVSPGKTTVEVRLPDRKGRAARPAADERPGGRGRRGGGKPAKGDRR